jgi:hypothetical protein
MNTEEIKRLLEKYYNAECSEEEEMILRKFFIEEDVPEELREEKEILNYYSVSSTVPEPSDGFEERIISAIDNAETVFTTTSRRKLWLSITSIAAGLLILAGSYFFFINRSENTDTFSDPDIAYAEAMKILYNVSARLNRGTKALETVAMMQDVPGKSLKTINRSTTIIEEKLKTLNYFNKAVEIINPNKKEVENK